MPDTTNNGKPLPEEVARLALEGVRILVEDRGWDAPFSVYGLRRVDESVRDSFPGEPVEAVEIVLLGEGSHPFEDLPGRHLPTGFEAAILATEGWQYPRRLEGVHRAELELEGAPSSLPDRLENRLFTYLGRTGDSFSLLLTYEDRCTPPEEVRDAQGIAGRVQDAFRRFVGLPVEPVESVVHVLGRFWLGGLLAALGSRSDLAVDDALVRVSDPLEAFVSALREALPELLAEDGAVDGLASVAPEAFLRPAAERLLREIALETIERFEWEDLRSAALLGVLDVGVPLHVVEWCDAGMFARIVCENVSPQRELLDAVMASAPEIAAAVVEELGRRGWLEPVLDSFTPPLQA